MKTAENKDPQKETSEKEFELPYVIKLDYPVEWGSETRDTITIKRRLKGKDLKGIPTENLKIGDMFKLVSKVTAEPNTFIDELDSKDLFKAIDVVKSFLPSTQMTGEDS